MRSTERIFSDTPCERSEPSVHVSQNHAFGEPEIIPRVAAGSVKKISV